MTVKETRRTWSDKLRHAEVTEPEDSADFIIAHALGEKTLSSVRQSYQVDKHTLQNIHNMMQKRLQHMPVQYILEEWDFRDLTLKMKSPVLIPRPETEELVELMMQDPVVASAGHFVEIGTGSGAICLSLLKEYHSLCCTGVEPGDAAANLTKCNADRVGVTQRLNLLHMALSSDTLDHVIDLCAHLQVDYIVSNPPYIPSHLLHSLQPEVRDFEDEKALDGGHDGLDIIRNILKFGASVLRPGGSLWLETDSSHPSIIEDIASDHDMKFVKTHKDFQNLDRFCFLQKL